MKRCTVAVFPLRAEASHRSEMVSQILYGEKYEVLETAGDWQRIRLVFDNYEGWVEAVPGGEVSDQKENAVTLPFIVENGRVLPMGSLAEQSQPPAPGITETAQSLLNAPYLWGGRTFMGIDCSGFTQVVFKANGIALPRDAYQQANTGIPVDLESSRAGDLAFFTNHKGKVSHVGILLPDGKIIHASRFVRIQKITREGIVDEEGRRTHELSDVRRIT